MIEQAYPTSARKGANFKKSISPGVASYFQSVG